MPLKIIRNDITTMKVDAIVNAANTSLKSGGGVCGAIFAAAGERSLQDECDTIGFLSTGCAAITKGYNLPAKYIIHTVGPVWTNGNSNEEHLLIACYENALSLALKHHITSIAFPLISSGIFGYPKDEALKIATSTLGKFLLQHEMLVYLVVYDETSYRLSEKLFTSIENYIDTHYVEERELYTQDRKQKLYESSENYVNEHITSASFSRELHSDSVLKKSKRSLDDVISNLDESFSDMLLRLIQEKGLSDVATYKKANIDRKLFSKIRSHKDYVPSRVTAIAFSIALELSLDETKDLLSRAGYTLSRSSKFDVIIEYFIESSIYNIFEINEALFAFGLNLLGE